MSSAFHCSGLNFALKGKQNIYILNKDVHYLSQEWDILKKVNYTKILFSFFKKKKL